MTTWIKRILLFLLIIFLAVLGLCAYRMHSATRAVPVLNYHQINDRDENSLTVHTDEFDEQMKYLSDNGVKEMDTKQGSDFDADLHEAIATIPAPAEDLKGKIIDTTQKGYMINDKVLRHAKVVVGE